MYSLKAILEKEPAAIAEAVRTIGLLLVAFGVIRLGEQNLALAAIAVSVLLQLFVRQQSTSTKYPTLTTGTEVKVSGTEDSVVIQSTPPGPIGIEGDEPLPPGPTAGG